MFSVSLELLYQMIQYSTLYLHVLWYALLICGSLHGVTALNWLLVLSAVHVCVIMRQDDSLNFSDSLWLPGLQMHQIQTYNI